MILRYGVTEEGNFEGGRTILHVTAPIDAVSQRLGRDVRPLLVAARRTLYEVRPRRPAPARDDKAIAAWNGLAIAAFADAGRILGREDFVDATATAAVVLREMIVEGRLLRTFRTGGRSTSASSTITPPSRMGCSRSTRPRSSPAG